MERGRSRAERLREGAGYRDRTSGLRRSRLARGWRRASLGRLSQTRGPTCVAQSACACRVMWISKSRTTFPMGSPMQLRRSISTISRRRSGCGYYMAPVRRGSTGAARSLGPNSDWTARIYGWGLPADVEADRLPAGWNEESYVLCAAAFMDAPSARFDDQVKLVTDLPDQPFSEVGRKSDPRGRHPVFQ
jgi:hypothetical protein